MSLADAAAATESGGAKLSQIITDTISRTHLVRDTAAGKITELQKITGALRMLALNALIESAPRRRPRSRLLGGGRGGAGDRDARRRHR